MSDHERTPTARLTPPLSDPQHAPHAAKARSPILLLAGCGGAILLLLSLVAFLRPGRAAASHGTDVATLGAASGEAAALAAAEFTGPNEGRCACPKSGAGMAALVAADAAYDAGDWQGARDRYLDLLLGGGDFGEEAPAILAWAHGRLALSLARTAHDPAAPLIDEPKLTFRRSTR